MEEMGTIISLFQTDVLAPAQFWGKCGVERALGPEKRLMLAVLQDGIETFQKHLLQRDVRFREAEEWILEASTDSPFSFESLCETFGWDPRSIRRELLRWSEKQLANRRWVRHPHARRFARRQYAEGASHRSRAL